MKPVKVIVNCHIEKFEAMCADAISDGYIMHSSNSAATGDCQDEIYQAIFVLPVSHTKEEKINGVQHSHTAISLVDEFVDMCDLTEIQRITMSNFRDWAEKQQ